MSGVERGASAVARAYAAAAPWLSLTWQLVGTALLGVAAGVGVDHWVGWGPWGLIAGGALGSALGFWAFVRGVNRLLEGEKKAQGSEGPAVDGREVDTRRRRSGGSPSAEAEAESSTSAGAARVPPAATGVEANSKHDAK